MSLWLIVAGLITAALLVNIPLGYMRQGCEKFTFGWFFYVHISIPLIIVLRTKAGLNWKFIPFTLGSAVLGQVIGGRIRRKRLSNG